MRQDVSRIAMLAAAILIAGSCGTRGADPVGGASEDAVPCETVLRIHGSTTIGANLMQDLLLPFLNAEGWTDLKTAPAADGASYTVVGRPSGSAKLGGVYVEVSDPESALTALDQGFADIAMSSRRVRPAEIRRLARLGDLTTPKFEHVLALDAVAIIVNAANPVDALTRQQLKDIYLRHTTSWQDVGGSGPIHLYARDPKSGTSATFQSAILDDEEISPDAMRLSDNRALAEAVAADPRGIGFVAGTFAGSNHVVAISDGKSEPHALRPIASSIRNGEYLMARRLYLYTGGQPENPLVQKFLKFALGTGGQAIVLKGGFVSPTFESSVPREPVTSLASSPPATPSPPAEARPNPTPATPEVSTAPARHRRTEPPPPATPRVRAEAPPPKPTPTPRPPRPAATRPQSSPASTPDQNAGGTGG
jgi:phosphate transport system substrate-binding protein